MVEVMVWLLITAGNNGASHVVSQFKTEQSCNKAKEQLFYPRSAKCIQANIYIKKD